MTTEETYTITGMSCAACSSAVERVTRKIAGVESSSVNLATGKMTISYNPDKVTPELIVAKVERAGFGCAPFKPQEAKTTPSAQERTPASDVQDRELQEKKHRLIGAWIFTLTLMYVSMGSMLPTPLPLPDLMKSGIHPTNFALLQLLLAIPVLFYGRFFYTNGLSALLHGNPNMNSLVALGSSVSFVYSLVLTFLVGDHPHQLHHLYYESATMVLPFVMTGKYLEERGDISPFLSP